LKKVSKLNGDKKIIEEVKSEIQGLKDHIQNNLG
jgi:hypothetical protein